MYNRKTHPRDFPGGPVVMNPSANAGGMDSIPDFGNISHAVEKLSLCATTTEPVCCDY